jgi:uncharacterized membrane protein
MRLRQTTDRYGFRYRGGENTRIEAFTDAAFAFSVTLLMIGGGHVPTNVEQLTAALANVPGYAFSFALLCVFWYAHYIWYRRYGIEDGHSVLLSLLLVFLVLIYVYPLHMMFDAAIRIGSGSSLQPRSGRDWRTMYEIFGIAYVSMSGVILLFYAHALRLRGELELSPAEIVVTQAGIWRWAIQATIGALSVLLAAAFLPDAASGLDALPGAAYWLIAASGVLLKQRLRRRLAAIGPAQA